MTGSDRFAPVGSLLAALLVAALPNLFTPSQGARHASPPLAVSSASATPSDPATLRPALAGRPKAGTRQPVPGTHTIAAGETLWDVSRSAGITVAVLAEANHISENATLHPGQVLVVPGSAAAGSAAAASRLYTVVEGDTLWDIARDSDVSVAALMAANDLSEDAILHPGRVLRVPPPGTPAPARRMAVRMTALMRQATGDMPAPAGTQIGAEWPQMLWPSSGAVSSRFGWRIHPIFGTREFHTGVDIAARWGSPVMAARSGIVRFAGWMLGYGRLIVVDHGSGLQTTYAHLSSALVGPGQHVDQGQVIGRIGSTGWSTGPHLFFEIRRNGAPEDPTRYLR